MSEEKTPPPEHKPGEMMKRLLRSDAVRFEQTLAAGPGGQNVNKNATAVQLRFDLDACDQLSHREKKRLRELAGKRLNSDGVLVIQARNHRGVELNRRDALERLLRIIQKAKTKPKRRIKTKPTKASKERRLENKRRNAQTKRLRSEKPR